MDIVSFIYTEKIIRLNFRAEPKIKPNYIKCSILKVGVLLSSNINTDTSSSI